MSRPGVELGKRKFFYYIVIFLLYSTGVFSMQNFCFRVLNSVSMGQNADYFLRFLNEYQVETIGIDGTKVTVKDIVPGVAHNLELTSFRAMHDIYIYSKVLSRAIGYAEKLKISQIVDLGIGSSLPMIAALRNNPNSKIKVFGIDIDKEALKVSHHNVGTLQIGDRFQFQEYDMLSFLKDKSFSEPIVLASNPPYLPFPSHLAKDYRFADGGIDGTQFLSKILAKNLPSNSILALNFSTLSNPKKLIDEIQKNYEIVDVQYYQVEKGRYTEIPEVKSFLQENVSSVYDIGVGGELSWGIVGIIARRK